jgi:hypothetical protein
VELESGWINCGPQALFANNHDVGTVNGLATVFGKEKETP